MNCGKRMTQLLFIKLLVSFIFMEEYGKYNGIILQTFLDFNNRVCPSFNGERSQEGHAESCKERNNDTGRNFG